MASKKNLKKDVKYITWELISECLVFQVLHPEASEDRIMETLRNVTDKHNEVMDLINSSRGKQEKAKIRTTYTEVIARLNEMTDVVKALYTK
ncbi:MAG: hypothetical protein U0T82_17190 [Bacteroidales bacterium]